MIWFIKLIDLHVFLLNYYFFLLFFFKTSFSDQSEYNYITIEKFNVWKIIISCSCFHLEAFLKVA